MLGVSTRLLLLLVELVSADASFNVLTTRNGSTTNDLSATTNSLISDTIFTTSTTSSFSSSTFTSSNISGTSQQSSISSTEGVIASYILKGLQPESTGATTTSSSSIFSASITTSQSNVYNTTSTSPSPTDPWEECQSSQVAYSESSSQSFFYTYSTTVTVPASSGTSCITFTTVSAAASPPYATIQGYPRIRGTYIVSSVTTATCTAFSYEPFEKPTIATNITSPSCTIPASQCSTMWHSYLGSHGITVSDLADATEPLITPIPSNRPRCSLGVAKWTCSTSSTLANRCTILFNSVKLLYWPTMNTDITSPAKVVTAHYENHILTSPSVYISVGPLAASFVEYEACGITTPLGAGTTYTENLPLAMGRPPQSVNSIVLPSDLLTLEPGQLSSVVLDLGPGVDSSSAARSIAESGYDPGFMSVVTKAMNYSQLMQPPSPESYYLIPKSYANGPEAGWPCDGTADYWPFPSCTKIFDNLYAPYLAVPPSWSSIIPEDWKMCEWSQLAGLYDPPTALQEATEIPQAVLPTFANTVATQDPHTTTASPAAQITPAAPEPTSDPLKANTLVHVVNPTVQSDQLFTQTPSSPPTSPAPEDQQNSPAPPTLDPVTDAPPAQPIPDETTPTDIPTNPSNPTIPETPTLTPSIQFQPLAASPTAILTLGQSTFTAIGLSGSSTFEIAGTTLYVGGPAAIINSQTVSAATGGVVVYQSPVPTADISGGPGVGVGGGAGTGAGGGTGVGGGTGTGTTEMVVRTTVGFGVGSPLDDGGGPTAGMGFTTGLLTSGSGESEVGVTSTKDSAATGYLSGSGSGSSSAAVTVVSQSDARFVRLDGRMMGWVGFMGFWALVW